MESEIERLPLEHPLPEEIRCMGKEDTVCQFCGVSYFIHREVKLLEEKVKAVELELQQYKGYKERSEQAELEIIKLKENEKRLSDEVTKRDTSLDQLKLAVREKEEIAHKKDEELDKVKRDCMNVSRFNALLRSRMENVQDGLSMVQPTIQEQRSAVNDIRAELQKTVSDYSKAFEQLTELVKELQEKFKDEIRCYQQQIEDLKKANKDLGRRCAETMQRAESSDSHLMNIQQLQQDIQRLQAKEEEYKKKAADAEALLERVQEKERSTSVEVAQLKHLLQNKSHEVEEVTTQHRKQDKISQDLIAKLRLEIRQKIEALETSKAEQTELKEALDDQRREENELKQRARVSTDEIEGMRGMIARVTEECQDLRKEREMMIRSHQTRIEQLKENFKKKLAEADSWPAKMDDILKQEKDRHSAALAELERSLTESFQVELEIERQKSEETAKREKRSLSAAENKFKADMDRISSKHREELGRLEGKLEDEHRNYINVEHSLREEVNSLKAVITDLENRLGELHSSQGDVSRNLKAELREAEDDLVTSKNENRQLREIVEKAKEEVLVLQETVRRECEERLQLTDALGVAKEQLLKLQREKSILSKAQAVPPDADVFSNPANSSSLPSPCPPSTRRGSHQMMQPPSDHPGSAQPLASLSSDLSQRTKSPNLSERSRSELKSDPSLDGPKSTPTFTVYSGRKTKKGGNRRKIVPNDKKR